MLRVIYDICISYKTYVINYKMPGHSNIYGNTLSMLCLIYNRENQNIKHDASLYHKNTCGHTFMDLITNKS